ncbi:MAG TPA: Omp28-related outer membrane protein [Salinivirgaceae bacterium]|nr:Omp28-related outer membrane protein [Salinivirgaceae bacterium]HQA75901.1 Omp28-related outer membrane protein [Salinivirgaceae bacterium]
MKKFFIALFALIPLANSAQTIVSTTPQNKNVVLEQYTGINCPYCPEGTTVANQIYNANPTRVVIIAIHAGNYANPSAGQPDFRTSFGTGLMGQTSLTGFPAGTVNRHVFSGYSMTSGGTAMGRGYWSSAANQILAQPSYVNVGATAEIDLLTREISVYVEAYYTGNSPATTNKINVVLLQDKTYAYQANGGSNYEHNNRLIHMITGQWGADITQTSTGSLYSNTFTYTIPEHLNQIPIVLENLRVAAFVAEGTQEIISGLQIKPALVNMPEFEYQIVGHSIANDVWEGRIAPKFSVKSLGSSVTSLDIEYKVNNEQAHSYTWNGNPQYQEIFEIELPEITFDAQNTNTLIINILNEDSSPQNNSLSVTLNLAPTSPVKNLTVEVKPDYQPRQTTWNIKNEAGTIIANGGPTNTSVTTDDLLLEDGFYTLTVFDSNGDGITGGGYVKIKSGDKQILNIPGSIIGSSISKKFIVNNTVDIGFNPYDGSTSAPANGPFDIYSNIQLYTPEGEVINEYNAYFAIKLSRNTHDGQILPYTPFVYGENTISIVPDYTLSDGTVVCLSLNAKTESGYAVKRTVHFTVGPVGISESEYSTVSIYPNPAKDSFTISGVDFGEVSVYSLNGQMVLNQKINPSNNIISTGNMQGVYIVKIQTTDKSIVKQLIVIE